MTHFALHDKVLILVKFSGLMASCHQAESPANGSPLDLLVIIQYTVTIRPNGVISLNNCIYPPEFI
ncbi:MAG: hypothetical protein AB8B64_16895 [Granulosicoccus sp.]